MAPRRSYAVVWRGPDGIAQPGRIAIADSAVRFEGGRGRLSTLTLPYADLASVRPARPAERLGGRPTLVLERRGGRPHVRLAAVGGTGTLAEPFDRLGSLLPVGSA